MTKRNFYVAAAALAITGTAGMASWLAVEADEPAPHLTAAATATPGVSETEAAVAPPAVPAAQPAFDVPAPTDAQPRIGGVVPAVRTSRTPIAAPERAIREPQITEPARTTNPSNQSNPSIPSNPEPGTEPVEPREPVERVEPGVPRFVELVVPANAVLGLRLSTSLSSDTAEVEDRVEATVTRDVIAEGRVAIPAGTRVLGSVNEVTRGGKFRERARLGVRFHTLVLADGIHEALKVDAIVREGESPVRESAAKIGGSAIGGAIIGGIIGGRKGALIGTAAGAGAGTAAVAAGDRSVATLSAGSPVSVRLDAPVTIKREQ